MKKRLSLVAAVLICGLMCTTCSILNNVLRGAVSNAVKAPEVTLKSVDFSNIDFTGLTLLSTLSVRNSNSIDIPLPKIDWDLLVINNPFVNGIIQSNGSLKSQGSTEVQFPVNITYANLIKVITALTDNNAKYKMKMTAHIPVPGLGDMSWPFEHEGKIPIMRVPNITIAAVPSTSFTYGTIPGVPTGATIAFALNVKNNSNVAVKVNDLSYDFKVGANSLSRGEVSGKPTIDPGATEKVTINFSLTASDILNVGAKAITGNYSYTLTGNYKFGIPEFPLLNEVGDSYTLKR